MDERRLIKLAYDARKHSYAPYSGFCVGAALLTKEGKVYLGCNIENAAYTPSCCAERTAFFKALSEGERSFEAIAIVGGADGTKNGETCAPCGVCRQVMREFCDQKTFHVILEDGKGGFLNLTLEELMPLSFGPENLGK